MTGFFKSYGDIEGRPEIDDATPAIAITILLFLMPNEPSAFLRLRPASEFLIDWKTVEKKLPWGIILLLGGGFALAAVTECSGRVIYVHCQKIRKRILVLEFRAKTIQE